MDYKDIQNLIKLVDRYQLSEFKMKDGEFELSIRTQNFTRKSEKIVASPSFVPVTPQAEAHAEAPAPAAAPAKASESTESGSDEGLVEVKSPIVGTFYRSPSPDKPPYFKVGDQINAGDVVCIVEAMKLFNEIESEVSGKLVKVLVEDASPVEYDQVLFLLDPKG